MEKATQQDSSVTYFQGNFLGSYMCAKINIRVFIGMQ